MKGNTRPVLLGLTTLTASLLTSACGDQPDAVGICTDPQTHERIADKYCEDGHHDYDNDGGGSNAFLWYYLGTQSGNRVPAVGDRYSGGTYHSSRFSNPSVGGAPKTGASSVKSFAKSPAFSKSSGFGGAKSSG